MFTKNEQRKRMNNMPQKESGFVVQPTAQGIARPYAIQGDTLRSNTNPGADRLRHKVGHDALKMECGGMV